MYSENGRPRVGTGFCELGVRVGPKRRHPEVTIGADGLVVVNRQGMSVAASLRDLPGVVVPARLGDEFNGADKEAEGDDDLVVFVHGDGAFEEGAVADGLVMAHKDGCITGGVVRPDCPVPVESYLQNLAATRDGWTETEG